MLSILIKYSAIIICSFYLYIKLLNIKINKKMCLSFLLFLLLFLPELYFLRTYAAPLSIFITVMVFAFFMKEVIKTPINLSLTVSVISFGLAYFAFFIAAAIMSPIGYLLSLCLTEYLSDLVSLICIGIIQFILVTIPFKFKRLKKGMPFLKEYGSHDIGAYISILLLLAISLIGIKKSYDLIYIIPVFLSLACGFTLLFWWKKSISNNYIDQVKGKEINKLQKIIQNKDAELEKLKYHNKELSKIIHKDNKLIPAMEYAVKEYLLTAGDDTEDEMRLSRANELLEQLECISKERSGILKTYEVKSKTLPKTNVLSIDILLSYMLEKSKEYQIDFDLSVSGSVKLLIETIIDEADLKTLLADLIENAIIAAKTCTMKKIMVHIGISNRYYSIDIFDSGIPFAIKTLQNIGLKRTTTHIREGGSGIGLMTAFEIIKKYQASFIIDELTGNDLFTKNVSICFDHLGEYRIKTDDRNKLGLLSKRTDIILTND